MPRVRMKENVRLPSRFLVVVLCKISRSVWVVSTTSTMMLLL